MNIGYYDPMKLNKLSLKIPFFMWMTIMRVTESAVSMFCAATEYLQGAAGWWIRKCDKRKLHSAMAVGLQNMTRWITECD